jgi:hypothetical protein
LCSNNVEDVQPASGNMVASTPCACKCSNCKSGKCKEEGCRGKNKKACPNRKCENCKKLRRHCLCNAA